MKLGPAKLSPEQAVLKLDIDAGQVLPTHRVIDHRLARAGYERVVCTYRRSPGGDGWHVELWVEPQPESPLEVVALQAILGSDPLRESCNMVRAKAFAQASPFWRDRWNVLYIKKSSHGKGPS
jgi:hypothetical protein